jgi:hypothetical protein
MGSLIHKTQVGLVHERRRLEGTAGALALESTVRHVVKLAIERLDQPLTGFGVPALQARSRSVTSAGEVMGSGAHFLS